MGPAEHPGEGAAPASEPAGVPRGPSPERVLKTDQGPSSGVRVRHPDDVVQAAVG